MTSGEDPPYVLNVRLGGRENWTRGFAGEIFGPYGESNGDRSVVRPADWSPEGMKSLSTNE